METMTDHAVICAKGLTRYFGARAAVYELNLEVPRGSVFAFVGRNGSGKSTTIRMLLGLLAPTRGSATVLGCDSRHLTPEIRARVGYLAEGHPVYGWMRVSEAGRYQSRFYPRWNDRLFHAILDHFRVDPKTRAKNMSRGERAGLCLAIARKVFATLAQRSAASLRRRSRSRWFGSTACSSSMIARPTTTESGLLSS